jgi:hypothetical protein
MASQSPPSIIDLQCDGVVTTRGCALNRPGFARGWGPGRRAARALSWTTSRWPPRWATTRSGSNAKQQAIRSVGSLAVDAAGNPAPFTSPTAYQRASVSVPFGNCTEPSNVKAGGGACPIRFQCAGCGFYRPDPSYLPALEQHIAALRADRETAAAIGAADYVIDNLTAEIHAFTDVADTTRRRLDALPPGERDEVEHASKILRRARGARQLPLINTSSTTGAAG